VNLQPSEPLRPQAEILLAQFPLKAADALQLAAAYIWSSGGPGQCVFICGDTPLLEASRDLGFQTIAAS
jgi:hypothetical protein